VCAGCWKIERAPDLRRSTISYRIRSTGPWSPFGCRRHFSNTPGGGKGAGGLGEDTNYSAITP
jgi:hypothetical protein